jgi:hypothetical protein
MEKVVQWEEPHNLYSSPNIIRQIKSRWMRRTGHVACMGEERKAYKVLAGKPKGKRPLGRPRCRWENVIRMDLGEIGWGGGRIGLDWPRIGTSSKLLWMWWLAFGFLHHIVTWKPLVQQCENSIQYVHRKPQVNIYAPNDHLLTDAAEGHIKMSRLLCVLY